MRKTRPRHSRDSTNGWRGRRRSTTSWIACVLAVGALSCAHETIYLKAPCPIPTEGAIDTVEEMVTTCEPLWQLGFACDYDEFLLYLALQENYCNASE